MSSLPEIDHSKVSQRLASKVSESTLHVFQLEVLAEALRDERDTALLNLEAVTTERDELRNRLTELEGGKTDGV